MFKSPVAPSTSFAKAAIRECRYGDGRGGHGLGFLAERSASGRLSKSWSQRLTLNGTNTRRGLGSHPGVTLASARKRALSNVQALKDGRNPWERKPTFAELADRTVAMNSSSRCGGRTEAIWRSTLNTCEIPLFDEQRVGEIGTGDALRCLEPIWIERPHTARKPRMMLPYVFKPPIANGHRRADQAQPCWHFSQGGTSCRGIILPCCTNALAPCWPPCGVRRPTWLQSSARNGWFMPPAVRSRPELPYGGHGTWEPNLGHSSRAEQDGMGAPGPLSVDSMKLLAGAWDLRGLRIFCFRASGER